jgi:hypothetical protein
VQRSPTARRYHLYLPPLAFGALAKTPVGVFAPLLMVYVFLFSDERRSWRRAFRSALPSLATGIAQLNTTAPRNTSDPFAAPDNGASSNAMQPRHADVMQAIDAIGIGAETVGDTVRLPRETREQRETRERRRGARQHERVRSGT